jgi:hypothetical protein
MTIDEATRRKGHEEHYATYERRAQAIGIARLCSLVPATLEELKAAYEINPHFNRAIPLEKWDRMDSLVRDARRRVNIPGESYRDEQGKAKFLWSQADSVCVLKHVAKYHILGVTKEEQYEWASYEHKYSNYGNIPVSRTDCLREAAEAQSRKVRAGSLTDTQL